MKAAFILLLSVTVAQAQVFMPHRHIVPALLSTPPCADNLVFWLKASEYDGVVADGSTITKLTDFTIHGNTFHSSGEQYASNAINGLSAIRFLCTNQNAFTMTNTASPSGWWNDAVSYHLFYVMKSDVPCGITGAGLAPGNGWDMFKGNAATGADSKYPADAGTVYGGQAISTFQSTGQRNFRSWTNVQSWAIVDLMSSNNLWYCAINGITNRIDPVNTVSGQTASTSVIFGRNTASGNTAYFNGWIAEMLMYTNALDSFCRSSTVQYLSQKYGIPTYDHGPVSTNSMVALWHLDETTGNRADSFGANTLTAFNGPGFTSGIFTNACTFTNANSQCVYITDNAAMSMGTGVDFSVSGWVNFRGTNATCDLVVKGNANATATLAYQVFYDKSVNKLGFMISTGSTLGTVYNNTLIALNTWYCFTASRDAQQLSLFVNGLDCTSVTFNGSAQNEAGAFAIGGDKDGNARFSDTAIDDVIIWKRVVTYPEHVNIYFNGVGKTYPGFEQ